MSDGFTISEISMQNDLARLRTISHNLANVTASGYKQQISSAQGFEETLNVTYAENAAARRSGFIPINVPSINNSIDARSGTLKFTGNALDIALTDGVYLVVNTGKGELYTRQGDMHTDAQGRLVTSKGMQFMGASGAIQLTTDKPVINQQGQIIEKGNTVAELKLVRIKNDAELTSVGDGLYNTSYQVEVIDNENVVRQGYVEGSNVDMTAQMVKMIELTRHFESTQRVIRGYDEMLDKAINVIGEF